MRKVQRSILLTMALGGAAAILPCMLMAGEKTFRGEIADTQCALNVHSLSQSHKEMIAMQTGLKTNADCARFCVRERGGRFVLQSKGKVYRLDKPDKAEPFAGQEVTIVGTLDEKTKTITVRSITPVTASASTSPTASH